MKRGLEGAVFGVGAATGVLGGILLASPLFGWQLGDSASNVISSAVGAAFAVFGAVAYELWRDRERNLIRDWKQVMLIYPIVARLNGQLSADMAASLGKLQRQQADAGWFDRQFVLDVEPLAAMLTDVDVLPRGLAQDLLMLVGWGRELNNMLELRIDRRAVGTAGVVMVGAAIADERMVKTIETVKDCAKFAGDVLEILRVQHQRETYRVEAKRFRWKTPPRE